jgi:hypothetical protein
MRVFITVFVFLLVLVLPACAPAASQDVSVPGKVQADLQSFLDKLDVDLKAGAVELGLAGIDNPAARPVLLRLAERQPIVIDVATVSPAGRILLVEPSAYQKSEGADISNQPQVRQLLKTHQPVMSGRMVMVEGLAAVDVEYPVFNASGGFTGSVSAIFDPGDLVASVIAMVPGTDGQRLYVVQADGVVIFSRNTAEIGEAGKFTLPSSWLPVRLHGMEWRVGVLPAG